MEKGLIHIYTGNGKGKTTAAMGLVSRAAGYNKKIYIMQFLKGRKTGEKIFFAQFENIHFKRAHKSKKFIKNMNINEKKKLTIKIEKVFKKVKKIIEQSEYEIIILDEIMGLINNDIIEVDDVISTIGNNMEKEIILTGRDAPQELIDTADYVTEMKAIKHPYTKGISARKGIEY